MANKYRIPNERGKLVFTSAKKYIKYQIDNGQGANLEHIQFNKKDNQYKNWYGNFGRFRRENGSFIPANQIKFIKDFAENISTPTNNLSEKEINQLISVVSEKRTTSVNSLDVEQKLTEFERNGGKIKINGEAVSLAHALEIFRKQFNKHRKEIAQSEEVKTTDVYAILYSLNININKNSLNLNLEDYDDYIISAGRNDNRKKKNRQTKKESNKIIKRRKAQIKKK